MSRFTSPELWVLSRVSSAAAEARRFPTLLLESATVASSSDDICIGFIVAVTVEVLVR